VLPDRCIERERPVDPTVYEREVGLLDLVTMELLAEKLVSRGVPGGEDEAGGPRVETMDEA
jgi:hypothetical protein